MIEGVSAKNYSHKHYNRLHDQIVEYFLNHPWYLHAPMPYITSCTSEVELYLRQELHVTPDLVFQMNDGERQWTQFYEVKSTDSSSAIRKGLSQLERVVEWATHNNIAYRAGLVHPTKKLHTYNPQKLPNQMTLRWHCHS